MGLWTGAGDGVLPAPSGILSANTSDLFTGNFLHVFSPTLTVEAHFGYTHMYEPGAPQNPSKVLRKDMGYPGKGVYGNANAPVVVSWGSGVSTMGDVGHDYHPNFYSEKGIPSGGVDLTKVYKTHTAKFGAFWENVYNVQDAWAQYMGAFDYSYWDNSSPSGNVYADELMGIGFQYTEQGYVSPTKMIWNDGSFYATDHWKATRHLVVDYGVRVEHYGVPYADNNVGSMTFTASKYQAGVKDSGLSFHGVDKSVPQSGGTAAAVLLTPRFGAAYDIFGNGKTTVRGGWGMYRYTSGANQGPADTAKGSIYWNCNGSNGCTKWEDIDSHINTGGATGTSTTCAAGKNCAPVVKVGTSISDYTNSSVGVIDPKNHDQPYSETYSVNFDQQLPHKLMFEASYVGSQTFKSQNSVNLNSIPLGTLNNSANITTSLLGLPTTATGPVSQLSLCAGMNGSAYDPKNPGAVLAAQQGNASCQQFYRPYTNYQNITANESSQKSRYDSFQTSLTRSSGWATLMLNYTFAKTLGNPTSSAAYKDYGVKEYWSVLSNNRAHVLNAAYVVDLPKFGGGNRLVRTVSNGWELSGVTTLQSGAQMSASNGYYYGMSNIGAQAQMVGSPDAVLAPVLTCNPAKGLKNGQYANASCFADPFGINNIGNARISYLAGPMFWNSDLTLDKKIDITERQKLELRIAGFNFLNHGLSSFSPGDANAKLNFDGTTHLLDNATDTTDKCPGPNCKAFGYADYHYGHRILEVSAKYTF